MLAEARQAEVCSVVAAMAADSVAATLGGGVVAESVGCADVDVLGGGGYGCGGDCGGEGGGVLGVGGDVGWFGGAAMVVAAVGLEVAELAAGEAAVVMVEA